MPPRKAATAEPAPSTIEPDATPDGAIVLFGDGSTMVFETVAAARAEVPRGWVMTAAEYAERESAQQSPDADGAPAPASEPL